jgi:hypothetical protein
MKDSLDAMIHEVTPVLTMSPDFRIATVTAYTRRLARILDDKRFRGNGDVAELRQRIAEFDSVALPVEVE